MCDECYKREHTVPLEADELINLGEAMGDYNITGWKEEAKKLSEAHWKWVEGLLAATDKNQFHLDLVAYVYRTAFQHGFEHGVEYVEAKSN